MPDKYIESKAAGHSGNHCASGKRENDFFDLFLLKLASSLFQVGKQGLSSANGGAENLSFQSKVLLASAAGAAGGFVGTPADMINVRMQNDIKLPAESRRK